MKRVKIDEFHIKVILGALLLVALLLQGSVADESKEIHAKIDSMREDIEDIRESQELTRSLIEEIGYYESIGRMSGLSSFDAGDN